MSTAVFDKALELLPAGAALAATGQGTGVLLYPRLLPTCDWVICASAVVATGTYVFNLQVSDVVGGTYTTSATFTWPPAQASGRVHIAINSNAAAALDAESEFIRVA